jgi:hypothetical protein
MSKSGSLLTLVLLLVYAASSLRLDSIHQLLHAEDITELHSAEKESDPCHKNIYHQQKETGCEHKSHITENTKCSFCEHNGGFKEILTDRIEVSVSFQTPISDLFNHEEILSPYLHPGAGRSPPKA